MQEVRVWSQHDPATNARIERELPGTRVFSIPLFPESTPDPLADVLYASGRMRVPQAPWLPPLGWVHVASAGVEECPREVMKAKLVTCSRGVRSRAIAEFALTAVLANAKQLPEAWSPGASAALPLRGLAGRTLGIIGLGSTGQWVARLAEPFGMRIIGVRRTASSGRIAGAELVGLPRLLRESDDIVVTAPYTALTRCLIDAAAFEMMRDGVHLVNVSRGSLVSTSALLHALDSGKVARASLDVTEPEPLPDDHPLRRHPRALISPHLSYQDGQGAGPMDDLFIANLRRYLSGQTLEGIVDVDAGY